ncbi:MAG TPA: GGDEF domain-containing protein, partial [Pseudolabrys sp.]|nr:GGDEF domain-containing protein [Pseudolabrys sp.]
MPPSPLDVPTLSLVSICIAALLGLMLIFAWIQERNIRALAWWGAAYLIGASSMALWSAPAPLFTLPPEVPAALIFVACGMIWNGVRLFHSRPLLPAATFAGAIGWILLCQLPEISHDSYLRIALGAGVIATYTFFIAFELGRERRKSLYSRTAAVVVPMLHATIFLMPLAMRAWLPASFASAWLAVFTLETMLYAVGTAVIVLLMVKDHHLHIYRNAASTDELTGLLNRRAFMENALRLCAYSAKRNEPLTVLLFDLDHFKSINDRFGHAVGDDVLRLFAEIARTNMRSDDIIARIGGEEFAAIVPSSPEDAAKIANRVRLSFEAAGVTVAERPIGATVSVGAATAHSPVTDIDALIVRADAALYRAKRTGRNRLCTADEQQPTAGARLIAAARAARVAA